MGSIGKTMVDTIPKATIGIFHNQKVDTTVRDALRTPTASYNMGFVTGNMDAYTTTVHTVWRAVKEVKHHNAKKLGLQMEEGHCGRNYAPSQTMDQHPPPAVRACAALADELNNFFTCFKSSC